jgi:hypothetical protein
MPSFQKNVRLHIAPRIGAVPLASLIGVRLSALYRELESSGRADHKAGGGLSARTVRYIHTILSAALRDAIETGLIPANPAAKAKPPTAKQARSPERNPWDARQLAVFPGLVAGSTASCTWPGGCWPTPGCGAVNC